MKPFDGIRIGTPGLDPDREDRPQGDDAGAHVAAVGQGLGMTTPPCFVGDADPALVRVPGSGVHRHGALHLLTQGETRSTRRVRLFVDFMSARLASHANLLARRKAPSG